MCYCRSRGNQLSRIPDDLRARAGSGYGKPRSGGIGVFETVLLLGLPEILLATLLGAMLLFRCIYFLLPLGFATALFAGHEVALHRSHIERVRDTTADWLAEIGPHVWQSSSSSSA
ncbi:MAG: hypothetical protein ACREVK_06425 [Gammaproteobacteria bacterium]